MTSPLKPAAPHKRLSLMLVLACTTLNNQAADAKGSTGAPPPPSLTCQQSAGTGIQCLTGEAGPRLDLSFDFIFDKSQVTGAYQAEYVPGRGYTIDGGPLCGKLTITALPSHGGLSIATQGTCKSPAQMCINMKVSGPDPISFKKTVAVVQSGSIALGMQSDERLGTEIDPAHKTIRLCTNPVRQTDMGWAVDLWTGSQDDVKRALQNIHAKILSTTGDVVGFTKTDPVVKDGYLFIDMTQNNAQSVLSLIKRAGFPYTLIYAGTWASSLGSYDINKITYPDGLAGLQRVVKSANVLGVKIGLHTLTSFVAKTDPFASRKLADGLLIDDKSSLLQKMDAATSVAVAADSIATFPTQPAYYGNTKSGLDIIIDNEILSCAKIQKGERGSFAECKRGLYGTKASPHEAGAPILHIAERYGSYLADLRSGLKNEISSRLSSVISDAGIDMIYFDGGEVGTANGDPGWFVAEQQIDVLKKVHRPLLVEGSGVVPRLWPYLTRMVNDDFVSLAPITYLDTHKAGRVHKTRHDEFMPDNLGWLGLLKETPSYPPTTPEEVSTYVARSLALDIPIAIETHVDDLTNNPYTPRLLDIMAVGNRTIRTGTLKAETRTALSQGSWYYSDASPSALRQFRSVHTTTTPETNATPPLSANGDEKNLTLRIRKIRSMSLDDKANILLFDSKGAEKRLAPPAAITGANRGALEDSIVLSSENGAASESRFVKLVDNSASQSKALDLSGSRSMLVEFDYGSATPDASKAPSCSVINLQLQDNSGQFRDYLLYLSPGANQRKLIDYETSAAAILTDLLPAASSYAFKAAMRSFNFAAVTKLNLRWMKTCGDSPQLQIKKISMLKESPSNVANIRLDAGGKKYPVAESFKTGETLDVFPDGSLLRCKASNCTTSTIKWPMGKDVSGASISLEYSGQATAEVSIGLLGKSVPLQ